MKVFISWSGVRSRAVAEVLRTWLKDVIQAVDPWLSVDDIDKGQRWGLTLADELESTHAGVICLTPENLTAPWLLFEAGALSKLHKAARVCTYLINMPYADVRPGPLEQFQHTLATQEDTYRMVRSINAAIEEGQGRLTEDRLKRAFEHYWPDLQQCLDTLPEPQEPIPPPRKADDMLQEVLEVVRSLAKAPVQPFPAMSRANGYLARARSLQEFKEIIPQEEEKQFIEELVQFILGVASFEEHLARLSPDMAPQTNIRKAASMLENYLGVNLEKNLIIPESSPTPQGNKSEDTPAT